MGDELFIIGAGPAGLTAGIYGARAGFDVTILEKAMPGGYMGTVDYIENYPGFPEGIRGFDLAELMKKQAQRFNVKIVGTEVTALDRDGETMNIRTDSTGFQSSAVIITTGTSPKKLGVKGEDELRGRGISYCATCDGPLFKNKKVAVIGCGNSGLQEGRFLLNFVDSVVFVEILPTITAEAILQHAFDGETRAKFLLLHQLISINGGQRVESITVKDLDTGKDNNIEVNGVFIYAGLVPASGFLKGFVDLDQHGYVITDHELQTSVPGVFAAGDIRSGSRRQVITACGQGAEAALNAYHYVEKMCN
ncbi:hypothetical protein A2Y85_00755 [candidate division WOR-3 bacterium RBG_13_43_14]|uniref:FAD/NAD(P)-binding domain-containing protein n=1 Tax=candidate division WOR-3 bacterium RBG_13_43_14 TaxID=1802590 RepID=A0A1F4U8J4_UNCW3|nr:MAG: hypothetical protein A2Y85_00755 [candidate division WOR-3 bacterium RBG_13_43_14]